MDRRGQLLLLLSGLVLACWTRSDGVLRRFHAVRDRKSWTDARRHCRDKFTDLATIEDTSQDAEARRVAAGGHFWIGLFNSSWRWSSEDGDACMLSSFTGWSHNEPRLDCVTVSELGTWSTRDCGDRLYPLCYSAHYDKHFLVQRTMSWIDGQKYCRDKYSDLSSVHTEDDNRMVSELLRDVPQETGGGAEETGGGTGGGTEETGGGTKETKETKKTEETGGTEGSANVYTGGKNGGTTTVSTGGTTGPSNPLNVWIGLHRHMWAWSDRSAAPYRRWAEQSGEVGGHCVKADSSAGWVPAPCREKNYFLCYRDVRPAALTVVKVQLSGGRRADVNDPKLQDVLLQELQQRLAAAGITQEVKLRWRKQADGRIFHRQEEAEPAGLEDVVCDRETGVRWYR